MTGGRSLNRSLGGGECMWGTVVDWHRVSAEVSANCYSSTICGIRSESDCMGLIDSVKDPLDRGCGRGECEHA